MFAGITARAERAARRRAEARKQDLAARIAADRPRGVRAEADADGVRISGRGLRRRFALEPALRWLTMGYRT